MTIGNERALALALSETLVVETNSLHYLERIQSSTTKYILETVSNLSLKRDKSKTLANEYSVENMHRQFHGGTAENTTIVKCYASPLPFLALHPFLFPHLPYLSHHPPLAILISSYLLTLTPHSRPFPSSSPLPCFSPTILGADIYGSMPYTLTQVMPFQDFLRFGTCFPSVGLISVLQVGWIPPHQLGSMVVSPSSMASVLSALEDRLGLGA
ncbi:hypothetical protein C1H46_010741 [Malus baccata]|uniref:Uncharacterized protein n=1 Tax=Malus baccata TaxID=106549 RepID=A0A540MZ36_MALBA|nr:hypothetical protein C1H46_010741 [Malus baccata]